MKQSTKSFKSFTVTINQTAQNYQEKHMSVLKQFDKKELTARQKAEELSFRTRINGVSAATAQEVSRFNTGAILVKGAIEPILCHSIYAVLPTFVEKHSQGYTLHESLEIAAVGPLAFEFFMLRPEADIQKELIEVFQQVEQGYRAEIESYNAAIIQREIDSQVEREIRLEQKQQADAEQARRDRITQEVRDALGAK
ncbi:hypothetical protein ACKUFS_15645 [Pseudomonas cannabina]|nr:MULTISPECIES: hypothetical protein [Pseudomonas syringae group]MBM0140002.1 hypothetical protein [Pseudomonas cannabina pv. alisalensis]QHE98647.1 hypothetical protein PMA4326_020005 [Pseudomonas syringae pv. maculicola str. ES4326]QQN20867.1 hypothetical protein JGS08_19985 [Pseudomonas cannabina pv. alisalensis]UBY99314.1 hypothetical protein LCG56_09555 [Pseudomonas cannabina pv. alisalensis]